MSELSIQQTPDMPASPTEAKEDFVALDWWIAFGFTADAMILVDLFFLSVFTVDQIKIPF